MNAVAVDLPHVEKLIAKESISSRIRSGTLPNLMLSCPCHEDGDASLSLLVFDDGVVNLKCFAGCEREKVLAALGVTQADLEPPLTLDGFAAAKGLKVETLTTAGVVEGDNGIGFVYRGADGVPLERMRVRYRRSSKVVWDSAQKGKPTDGYLYGLDLFAATGERWVVLVEGESDTLTLIENGLPGVGIPGAAMPTKSITPAFIENLDRIVVVQENDEGGKTFAKNVKARLKALAWPGELIVIAPPVGCKDTNDHYRLRPATYRVEVEGLIAAATPAKVGKPKKLSAVEIKHGSEFPLTEAGMADYVRSKLQGFVRYCPVAKSYYVFDSTRWVRDVGGARVFNRILEAVRQFQADALDIADKDRKAATAAFGFAMESANGLAHVERIFRNRPGIVMHDAPEKWDANPWTLGVPNGVVDLKTGQLREGSPDDYITRQTAVDYDPAATCPTWEKCVKNCFPDPALASYFKRSLGYSLTGDVLESTFWIAWGTGSNGKTTLLTTPCDILGSYGHVAPFELFRATRSDQHPTEVAQLVGKRFIGSFEFEAKARLNEVRLKALTGGEKQRARNVFENSFEFAPQGKLWIATNARPTIRDTSHGFWRRINFVPFNQTFEKDPTLLPRLRAEWLGILRWMVEGCLEYQKVGLNPPAIVLDATSDLRQTTDHVQAWIGDRCIVEKTASETQAALWRDYETWARENLDEDDRMKHRRFLADLRERYQEGRSGAKGKTFKGLRLRRDDEPKPEPPDEDGPEVMRSDGSDGFIQPSSDRARVREGLVEPLTSITFSHRTVELTPADLIPFADGFPAGVVVALDTETTGLDVTTADLVGVSLAVNGDEGYWLSASLGRDALGGLLAALDAKGVRWALWNRAFDEPVLARTLGVTLTQVEDVMIARKLARAGQPGSDRLKDTAKELLGVEVVTYDAAVAGGVLAPYAVQDACFTWRLHERLVPTVNADLFAVENRVAVVVARATGNQWRVDATRARDELTYAGESLKAVEGRIRGAMGTLGPTVNLRSPKQLVDALLDAGISLSARTDAGQLRTDDETLAGIDHPVARDLVEFRRLSKAIKTGQTLADAGPLVRFKLHPLATDTGRMAGGGGGDDGTVKLNVQALPKRVPDGYPNPRRWLMASNDGWLVLSVDLAQVEPRITARLSGDEKLIAAFVEGRDCYTDIARELGITRQLAKMVWLAVIYGSGARNLADKTGIPVERMKALIAELYAKFPTLASWKADAEARAEADGQLVNAYGRIRKFRAGEFLGTRAANTLVQSTAADVFKRGLLAVERYLNPDFAHLALFIHDEVVLHVREDMVQAVARLVVEQLTSIDIGPVKLAAEAAVGPTLGELKELK